MVEITDAYLASQGLSYNFPTRFWSKVRKTASCWIWEAGTDSSGYGSIANCITPRKSVRAHVASWVLHFGPVPKGLQVLHDCPLADNRKCVNPKHLHLGTASDNVADKVRKGACHHKLNQGQADQARNDYFNQGESLRDIAQKLGVVHSTVYAIVKNRTWRA